MPQISRLIIGLGNPGDDYARTRHNIGFMVVDEIAIRTHCSAWKKKFRGLIAQGASNGTDFLLLKPQTFMNLSGESALDAMNFYQLKTDQVIVFHDDLDLLPGQVKIKQAGGSGGHNGLKSLDAHIGVNYWRVRLGIGRPMTEQGVMIKGGAVSNYVLNPFNKSDKIWLEPLIDKLALSFDTLLKDDRSTYATQMLGKGPNA